MCLGCGAATCSGCLTEFDAPRHCPRCGRKSRLKVHPAGWSAVCKSCGIESLGRGGTSGYGDAHFPEYTAVPPGRYPIYMKLSEIQL